MRLSIVISLLLLTACDDPPQNIALGTLERDRIAHTATVNEVITDLPIAQGSQVQKGDLIVKLDDTIQKAQVDKAAASVAEAEANLEKLRNGARIEEVAAARAKVAGAKAALVESEANYARTLKLSKSNSTTEAEIDKALASRDANIANLQTAQQGLRQLTNGTREEDLRAAEAHRDVMKATLVTEQKKLADLPWNLGERVTLGSPLAIVLAGKAPYARIYVPEPYRVKLKISDQLLIHVDGIENPIKGHIRWISNEPAFTPYYALNQEERSRLMYLAEVQLPDSEAHLPNGVPVQVELK